MFQFTSNFKDDLFVVSAAVTQNGKALQYASHNMKNNSEALWLWLAK
jgi:hypothetical protein